MTALRRKLYKALTKSYQDFNDSHKNSNKKLYSLHGFLAEEIQSIWGRQYKTHYLGKESKERTVEGEYYKKKVDIVTERGSIDVFALGVKSVMSSYGKNSNNYFEAMMGETANVQRIGVLYAQSIFLRNPMPICKDNVFQRWEYLTPHHLHKYVHLALDEPYSHQPFATCIHIYSIDDDNQAVEVSLDEETYGKEFVECYDDHFSIEALLREVKFVKTAYEDNASTRAFPWAR